MAGLTELVAADELLLLFVVVALGLSLGRVQVRGVRLGLAGVLFVGLALSAWWAAPGVRLSLAHELEELGLVLFVYCVGLTSGPGFFSAWKQRGLKLSTAIATSLVVGAAVAALGGRVLDIDRGLVAGIFCGALTNTPALGAASDRLAGSELSTQPVLGYSVTYPFGVLAALLAFRLFVHWNRKSLATEQARSAPGQPIATINLRVENPELAGRSIGELRVYEATGVMISRVRRGDQVFVPTKYTVLQIGDVIAAACDEPHRRAAVAYFGEAVTEHLEAQRGDIDMRRVLVSKREHVGKTLRELDLERRFNAQVTRIRRADVDLVASPEMHLELGDRLRVVAKATRLAELSAFFGDSERQLAEVDYVALALGLSAGLLLAHVPLSVMGTELRLGSAGGPLLVALVLGRLGRTGPFVWSVPYEANKMARDLGLLLFLAGVGVRAGASVHQVFSQTGLMVLLLGALVTLATTLVALGLARVWTRSGVIACLGATAGMQTQPATLEAAYELSGESAETYVAYALVYPVAMIEKILLAQLLAVFA